MAGPHDNQDGLTYWARRAGRGGRVALPADPDQPIQVIDSRDLARLVMQLLADDRPGPFHAVGLADPTTIGQPHPHLRPGGRHRSRARPRPAPAWRPPGHPGPHRLALPATQPGPRPRGRPARRPLLTTAADVLAWDDARGEPPLDRGFSPAQEQAILAGIGSRK